VHVVSVAGAKLLLQQKQIDTAYIAASLEHDTQELSEELSSLGISRSLSLQNAWRLWMLR
jgi:hypothetical protein